MVMDGSTDEVTDRYLDYLKSEVSVKTYFDLYVNGRSDAAVNTVTEEDIRNINIAEIKSLRMYNNVGREIEDINYGEDVVLKVGYVVADTTIKKPLLGVAIRRIDNEYICGLNTKLDNTSITWNKGYNEITLTYTGFNLVGGEYYFDVGIFDQTGIVNIDYKSKIKSFFVKMDYIAEGIVVLPHRWSKEDK